MLLWRQTDGEKEMVDLLEVYLVAIRQEHITGQSETSLHQPCILF